MSKNLEGWFPLRRTEIFRCFQTFGTPHGKSHPCVNGGWLWWYGSWKSHGEGGSEMPSSVREMDRASWQGKCCHRFPGNTFYKWWDFFHCYMLVLYVVTHNYLRDQTFETSSNNANRLLAFLEWISQRCCVVWVLPSYQYDSWPLGMKKNHQWKVFVNPTTRFKRQDLGTTHSWFLGVQPFVFFVKINQGWWHVCRSKLNMF